MIQVQSESYVTVYEVAKIMGRDPEKLRDSATRIRFGDRVKAIPGVRIITATPNVDHFKELGYPPDGFLYSLNDINTFRDRHITKTAAMEMIGVSRGTFDDYIKQCEVPTVILGKHKDLTFYPRNDIINIYTSKFFDTVEYMSLYELADCYFGCSSQSFIWRLRDCILALPPGLITPHKLIAQFHDVKAGRYVKVVYSRSEVQKFFATHTSKKEAFDHLFRLLNGNVEATYDFYKDTNVPEVNLGGIPERIFVSKDDLNKLLATVRARIEKQNAFQTSRVHRKTSRMGVFQENGVMYYTRKKVLEILNIEVATCHSLESNDRLIVAGSYKNMPYYAKAQVDALYEEQQRELMMLNEEYFSIREITENYTRNFALKMRNDQTDTVHSVPTPLYLRGYYQNSHRLYLQKDVEQHWDSYELNRRLVDTKRSDPFSEFVYKVDQVLEVKFNSRQVTTKTLWYDYVKGQLTNTMRLDIQIAINFYARTTQSLVKTFDREIYSYSSQEINERFLYEGSNFPRKQQAEVRRFLKRVAEAFATKTLPTPMNVSELNDPSKYSRIVEEKRDIYTLTEYQSLYNYVNQVEYHKSRAINDVEKFITTQDLREYRKYDSCWVYVLVHLTNNWRHSTIISQIPRIDLTHTRISGLEWLKNNSPNMDDANEIVYQVGRNVTHIHKTGVDSESIWTVGEPLKIAFATAISICEFRTRHTEDLAPHVIRLTSGANVLTTRLEKTRSPHTSFFEGFNPDFVFENRKMNRTLTTLVWSVLRQLGAGIDEAQQSRGHLRDDTTIDHYIMLEQDQLDALVNQLFERRHFGFVTQLLNAILSGSEVNKEIETKRMVQLEKIFGNTVKIEMTAGLVNKLAREKRQVQMYLSQLSISELTNLYQNMLANNLPSRQRYYQCIYSECIYSDEFGRMPACEGCPSAIINIYAMSQIMDAYLGSLMQIVSNFDTAPEGEKRRMANHFHMIYQRVQEARALFGRDVVDAFVDGGAQRLKDLGTLVSDKGIRNFISDFVIRGR